jgi:hypothetical protein
MMRVERRTHATQIRFLQPVPQQETDMEQAHDFPLAVVQAMAGEFLQTHRACDHYGDLDARLSGVGRDRVLRPDRAARK